MDPGTSIIRCGKSGFHHAQHGLQQLHNSGFLLPLPELMLSNVPIVYLASWPPEVRCHIPGLHYATKPENVNRNKWPV